MTAQPSIPFHLRPAVPADEPFLWEMLYQAIYLPPGAEPPPRAWLLAPELSRYVQAWGRAGDLGFIAFAADSRQPVGAAWLRLLVGDNRGYGYVDEHTPELSVAVLPPYRGAGIGGGLLSRLLAAAARHYQAVCLSVSADNPARRLYARLGFEIVTQTETSLTMRKRLSPPD